MDRKSTCIDIGCISVLLMPSCVNQSRQPSFSFVYSLNLSRYSMSLIIIILISILITTHWRELSNPLILNRIMYWIPIPTRTICDTMLNQSTTQTSTGLPSTFTQMMSTTNPEILQIPISSVTIFSCGVTCQTRFLGLGAVLEKPNSLLF